MELEKKLDIEQGNHQEPDQKEFDDAVSTGEITEEWEAPTKEEIERLVKSTSNKAKTELLKELGVLSIKEFKAKEEEIRGLAETFEELKKSNEEYKQRADAAQLEIDRLQKIQFLASKNIDDQYRDDLMKLAELQKEEGKSFEETVEELISDKYSFFIKGSEVVAKIGVGKKPSKQADPLRASDFIKSRYDFIK